MLRRRRILLLPVVAVAVLAVGVCAFFRITRPADFRAYQGLRGGAIHPVWKEFAFRHFDRGDSVAALLVRHPPSEVEEFGGYAVYTYYQPYTGPDLYLCGLAVSAKDGKLTGVRAWT